MGESDNIGAPTELMTVYGFESINISPLRG